jgi:ribosomal protein L37AE/L43A
VKSVLQGELAAKRNQIAKTHNRLVITLLGVLFVAMIGFAALARGIPHAVPVFLTSLVIGEVYGIYRIVLHDNEQCRQLGFICPFCHKPLYEARALIWNTLCPKCGEDIVQGASSGKASFLDVSGPA